MEGHRASQMVVEMLSCLCSFDPISQKDDSAFCEWHEQRCLSKMKEVAEKEHKHVDSDLAYYRLLATVLLRIEDAEASLKMIPDLDLSVSGTTLCAVLITDRGLVSFNLGDSRAILAGQNLRKGAVQSLTWDQKPSCRREKARVEKEGGQINAFRDERGRQTGPERLWFKLSNGGAQGIAMTRSIGDYFGKDWGLSAVPVVSSFHLKEDKVMIIASDGLWDEMANQECARIVSNAAGVEDAATRLRDQCLERWMADEGVLADDMTMIVAQLSVQKPAPGHLIPSNDKAFDNMNLEHLRRKSAMETAAGVCICRNTRCFSTNMTENSKDRNRPYSYFPGKIDGIVFKGEGSSDHGGCVSIDGSQYTLIRNSMFENCRADESGGALYIKGATSVVISNTVFKANVARN